MLVNSKIINTLKGNQVPKNIDGTYKFRLRKGTVGLDNKDPTRIAMMGGYITSDFFKNTNEALRIFYFALVDVEDDPLFLNLLPNKLFEIRKDYVRRLGNVKNKTEDLLHHLAIICYINNLLE